MHCNLLNVRDLFINPLGLNPAYFGAINANAMHSNVLTRQSIPMPLIMTVQIAKFMGPTWGPAGSCRPQMDPMLAPWTLLLGRIRWSLPSMGKSCFVKLTYKGIPSKIIYNFRAQIINLLWILCIQWVNTKRTNPWNDSKSGNTTSVCKTVRVGFN